MLRNSELKRRLQDSQPSLPVAWFLAGMNLPCGKVVVLGTLALLRVERNRSEIVMLSGLQRCAHVPQHVSSRSCPCDSTCGGLRASCA